MTRSYSNRPFLCALGRNYSCYQRVCSVRLFIAKGKLNKSTKGQGGTPPQLTCCLHRRKKEAHLLVIGEGCGGEEWRVREGWRGTDGGEGVGRKGKPLSPPSSYPHHLLVHLFVQPADHWRKNQTNPLTMKISPVGYKS